MQFLLGLISFNTIVGFRINLYRRRSQVLSGILWLSLAIAHAELWRTAYYPGWEQAGMPASSIDFNTLTHVVHFSVVPNSNGTLNSGVTLANSTDLVSKAHAAGRKVLICVGGADSENAFQGATSIANLPVFISNLTNFVATRGYDGVDIDWEPLPTADAQPFTNLVTGLRSALNGFSQQKLLTAAAGAYPPYGDSATAQYVMFARLQSQFDQINIMTYDLSGPYGGWVTWFNSPIYDGGYHFPSSGGLVPSVNVAVNNFINNGVVPGKLGIGIAFYGYIWTGGRGTSLSSITQPRQSWTNAPTVTAYRYTDIMAAYYQSNLYHWDVSAQAAYIGITNANPTNNLFISYDDPRTCQAKVSYARNRGLGGVMIWELAQDYTPNTPAPLLQAVKQALATPGPVNLQKKGADLNVTFTSIALGSYRVQWSSDLALGIWNTLLTTNVSGAGGPLQITDSGGVTNQLQRFYRIQTPP
ncbi:MAG TPA: glycoside hydrolase family 18 protein [Verrucomicrobiae bacterium]|nr:glycoside hydrolase family 18 protein [Verrucomicrobiae bacterium]